MKYKMYIPTKTIFGSGELNNMHKLLLPGRRALIVISNGKSVITNGTLARVKEQLAKAGVKYEIFNKIQANPLKSSTEEGGRVARENGCDFIVALGGGSVMDASKAIAIMATNDGDLWDYAQSGSGKGLPLKNLPLPIVAITTTAGTGSEVDAYGVITHDQRNEKIGIGGYDSLFPVIAIVDPELMLTVPPKFTAYQGFDALFHSTEIYISRLANPMSDMVALTAIENVAMNLPKAVANGKDLGAREKVAFGNTLSGYAMVLGCTTSEHSLEHAMSAYHHELPHGAGLIMISLAYYQHFIDCHACDERFVKMAKVMGVKGVVIPQDFITALHDLQKACGVAELKMSDYGITRKEFKKLAENAMTTMGKLFKSDPVELTLSDCVKIYEKSYK